MKWTIIDEGKFDMDRVICVIEPMGVPKGSAGWRVSAYDYATEAQAFIDLPALPSAEDNSSHG